MTACSKDSDQNAEAAKDPDVLGHVLLRARELLEARVLTTSYPPGYKPKRPTAVMPQFPFLKDEIPYLAAYLR